MNVEIFMTGDVTLTLARNRNPLCCLMCHKDHNLSQNELKLCIDVSDTFNNMYTKFHVCLIFSS